MSVIYTPQRRDNDHRVLKCDITKLWDLVPFSNRASLKEGPWQELHASPHIEYTPHIVLSIYCISIFGMSYPYIDMWTTMKKLPLNCNSQPKYKGSKSDSAPYKSL